MKNHFIFSGHDTVELAKKYGTPLYVLSEDIIRENARRIVDSFLSQNIEFDINYAGKAFLNTTMCLIVKDLGISLDVVSGGELYTALQVGFPPERICFHGSNKSIDEIKMAIENNVGTIIVDSEYELELINKLCALNKSINVVFRVSPGIEAHTHEYVQTGRADSKFGIPLKLVKRIIKKANTMENINIKGLHCHIGSQIFDKKPFIISANIMLNLIKDLKQNNNITISELNLGGGFGIPYLKDDSIFDIKEYVEEVVNYVKNFCESNNMKIPKLVVEPGRYIVGPAGITLYEVGTIKQIPHTRKYVSIDGGMADNPRPLLYGALHHAVIANRMIFNDEEEELVTISGKCCETDTLISDIVLPSPTAGDILAVFNTGAYNYSMSSNYNRLPKPAVLLLKGNNAEIIVEREDYKDLISKDRIPTWFK